jgi:hypothetical protein
MRLRGRNRLLFAALACLCLAPDARPHEIPADITIQVYFKPEGQRLRLLLRVPMSAMRDVTFPERDRGYLDLERVRPLLGDAAKVWISDSLAIYENDAALPRPRVVATRVSLPSDRSFVSWEQALAHVTGPPLDSSMNLIWNQTLLDVLLESPIRSDRAEFSLRSGLARLGIRVVTVLRFLPPGGAIRAFEYTSDPGLVRLDPRWTHAAARFVVEGFWHILDGTDHLLFLLCLVIPFRKFGALIPIVTAFTVAHSVTLIASAYGVAPDVLWFSPLVETLIAASIVYMAIENIVGAGTVHRRWITAFAFGLVHGFGFSFALRETLQFAGSHLLTSLVSFNVGIELGQLLVLVAMIPVLELVFRHLVAERIGTILLSAFVAHTGWHWMTDRGSQLTRFRFPWPSLTAATGAQALRWAMAAVAAGAAVWLVRTLLRRRAS